MKKTFIVIAVLTIVLLTLSSVTLAFGEHGRGPANHETCVLDYLSEEEQTRFMAVISEFQEIMLELREKMHELREEGNFEAFQEVKEARFAAMEEKQEELSKIVPAELSERFESRGRNNRNTNWEKGSGRFNQQHKSGQ